jgi:hypothetical protein
MNRTGLSSRISGHQYPGKKPTWKWTPAKIAAFSMFALMMGTIIYFESNSNKSTFEASTQVIDEPSFSLESTDFDKEYQNFLKRGKKIVTEETLDSLRQIQSSTQAESSSSRATESPTTAAETSTNNTPSRNNRTENNQSTPQTKSPAPINNSRKTQDRGVNLKSIERTQPATNRNPPPSNLGRSNLGSLEEITPPDEIISVDNSANKSGAVDSGVIENNDITEEFYIEETITGRILAVSDGAAIQGVIITVKGTSRKAVSDSNGRYSITVPGDPQQRTLQYTFRGNITERDVSPGSEVINVRF